jgi:glutamate-1-semialdehyde 2,1-aminomutase
VMGEAPVFEIYFTDRDVIDYRSTLTADRELHAAFTQECLRRGVTKAAQKFYVSLAHGEAEIQETAEVFTAALEAVAGTRR